MYHESFQQEEMWAGPIQASHTVKSPEACRHLTSPEESCSRAQLVNQTKYGFGRYAQNYQEISSLQDQERR